MNEINDKVVFQYMFNNIQNDRKEKFERIYNKISEIMFEMRALKMWSGDLPEKHRKMSYVLDRVCEALNIEKPRLIFKETQDDLVLGQCNPNSIIIYKYSVVTFLHELLHYISYKLNLGFNEMDVSVFSIEIFRRVFPEKFYSDDYKVVFEFTYPRFIKVR